MIKFIFVFLFSFASILFFNKMEANSLILIENISANEKSASPNLPHIKNQCIFDELESAKLNNNGKRKLALIVGIQAFKAGLPRLDFTVNDAKAFRKLLIDHFDFPAENVCMLLNQDATILNVRKAFEKMESLLIEQPSSIEDEKKDVALFYISSHGSRVNNHPEDEALLVDVEKDKLDSTLILYDSWYKDGASQPIWDLVDDEMYNLLGGLLKKTPNVVMIADTCHSGSLAKGDEDLRGKIKRIPLSGRPLGILQSPKSNYMHTENVIREKLVYLGASQDNQLAREMYNLKHGVFTHSLLEVAKKVPNRPLTYESFKVKIKNQMDKYWSKKQNPVLSGVGDVLLFGSENREKPSDALRITGVSNIHSELIKKNAIVKISVNPLMLGLGEGALFKVYDSHITAKDSEEEENIKAMLEVVESSQVELKAKVISHPKDEIFIGDLAVVHKKSKDFNLLKVNILNKSESPTQGLAVTLENAILKKINELSKSSLDIQIVDELPADIRLEMINFNGKSRVAIKSLYYSSVPVFIEKQAVEKHTAEEVILKLLSLSKHKRFLGMNGQSGGYFEDNETLKISLIPDYRRISLKDCYEEIGLSEIPPSNFDFEFQKNKTPFCSQYRINVKYSPSKGETSLPALYIGLVYLSGSDGAIIGFPRKKMRSEEVRLLPGESKDFPLGSKSVFTTLPIASIDKIIVIGTTDKREGWWELSEANLASRNASEEKKLSIELSPWTMTTVTVEAFNSSEGINR